MNLIRNYYPTLLFAAGLGIPVAKAWIDTTEEGVAKAEEWIKKHPEDPAYVLQIVKHLQGAVQTYEVSYQNG